MDIYDEANIPEWDAPPPRPPPGRAGMPLPPRPPLHGGAQIVYDPNVQPQGDLLYGTGDEVLCVCLQKHTLPANVSGGSDYDDASAPMVAQANAMAHAMQAGRRPVPPPMAPRGPPAAMPAPPPMALPPRVARSAEEALLLGELWYFQVERPVAEGMLRPEGDGSFLVRPHKQFLDCFVLSVRVQNGFSHMEITTKPGHTLGGKPKTFYVLGAFSETFNSVQELIDHHRQVEIEILGKPAVRLRDPEKVYGMHLSA